MEQNHYNDEFEKMLRESTDEFRMYPSRKVWHSIYNDLHPDRKWPSFAVCLVLLTAILHIGVSNNNSISKNSLNLLSSTLATTTDQKKDNTIDKEENSVLPNGSIAPINEPGETSGGNYFHHETNLDKTAIFDESKKAIPEKISLAEPGDNPEFDNGELVYIDGVPPLEIIEFKQHASGTETPQDGDHQSSESALSAINFTEDLDDIASFKSHPDYQVNATNNLSKAVTLSMHDKAWIDNFAFYNKKNKDKWKAKLSMQYYVTPSIGFRELYKNNNFEPNAGLLLTSSNVVNDLPHQAAANLEGGATALLKMNKRLRFKAGVQVNLTNYVTYAHKLEHPTQTTILLNMDNYIAPVSYSTNYGNVPGSNLDRLNNKTFQISLPIGADYRIYGNDKLKWFIGATIQPTRVLNGEVYLISSDQKNYASDPSMLKKWNLNSSVETFISYKMPSGLNVNIGPQLRYQLMSSYNKRYTYTEKLYNLGVKIGLSSNF